MFYDIGIDITISTFTPVKHDILLMEPIIVHLLQTTYYLQTCDEFLQNIIEII